MIKLTFNEYDKRVEAFPDSIFFRYGTLQQAKYSFFNKFQNPRFNNNELFIFEVIDYGFVVQTTGSLLKFGA